MQAFWLSFLFDYIYYKQWTVSVVHLAHYTKMVYSHLDDRGGGVLIVTSNFLYEAWDEPIPTHLRLMW